MYKAFNILPARGGGRCPDGVGQGTRAVGDGQRGRRADGVGVAAMGDLGGLWAVGGDGGHDGCDVADWGGGGPSFGPPAGA